MPVDADIVAVAYNGVVPAVDDIDVDAVADAAVVDDAAVDIQDWCYSHILK
jgi:hypothetical protein